MMNIMAKARSCSPQLRSQPEGDNQLDIIMDEAHPGKTGTMNMSPPSATRNKQTS
ncbi:MAG: hypothetical protein M3362_06905 [Acidobacteriota bacterium]|nr:hypothetical protein [Acidobacteriota bacterium]